MKITFRATIYNLWSSHIDELSTDILDIIFQRKQSNSLLNFKSFSQYFQRANWS